VVQWLSVSFTVTAEGQGFESVENIHFFLHFKLVEYLWSPCGTSAQVLTGLNQFT
jgi:hypothetical protein